MSIIGKYKNGNYDVTIYSDGTKVRETEEDKFKPAFAESIDVTITTECDRECSFCYLGCTKNGKHADLHQSWVDTLHPYTEIALNVNDLSHPDLDWFLEHLKEKKVITNISVNQEHFMKNYKRIKKWHDNKLVYGVGISLNSPLKAGFLKKVQSIPDAVIHTIYGITPLMAYRFMAYLNLKVLILGYKQIGRGKEFYEEKKNTVEMNQKTVSSNLDKLYDWFDVVSFDNLAIEQLDLKSRISKEDWNEMYMGDDGQFTFFIDMVNKQFAKSSLSPYKLGIDKCFYNADTMFKSFHIFLVAQGE